MNSAGLFTSPSAADRPSGSAGAATASASAIIGNARMDTNVQKPVSRLMKRQAQCRNYPHHGHLYPEVERERGRHRRRHPAPAGEPDERRPVMPRDCDESRGALRPQVNLQYVSAKHYRSVALYNAVEQKPLRYARHLAHVRYDVGRSHVAGAVLPDVNPGDELAYDVAAGSGSQQVRAEDERECFQHRGRYRFAKRLGQGRPERCPARP